MPEVKSAIHRYILTDCQAVPEPDLQKWAEWMQHANPQLACTEVGDGEVSTIFLGVDYELDSDKPPLLFETMIFGGMLSRQSERYSTMKEAIAGHKAMVKRAVLAAEGMPAVVDKALRLYEVTLSFKVMVVAHASRDAELFCEGWEVKDDIRPEAVSASEVTSLPAESWWANEPPYNSDGPDDETRSCNQILGAIEILRREDPAYMRDKLEYAGQLTIEEKVCTS